MKSTLGVNFKNILQTAFAQTDLKGAEKTDNLTVFFVLLGSAWLKADHTMLMKLTPGFNANLLAPPCPLREVSK
jgi:hypothetical protein